jgi:hypothetical protein
MSRYVNDAARTRYCVAEDPQPTAYRQLQVGADASHLPIIEWQSEVPGAITISVAPLKRADNAHLPGFKIARAGMPNPISRP